MVYKIVRKYIGSYFVKDYQHDNDYLIIEFKYWETRKPTYSLNSTFLLFGRYEVDRWIVIQ